MEDEGCSICKFNQTGFCKFKEHCRKKHENEICENINECTKQKCTKRHPKVCKNYTKYNKCRFNDVCAYYHEKEGNIQEELNEQFKLAMLKHERDIQELNKEVTNMKHIIHTLTLELAKCSQKHVSIVETVEKDEKKSSTVPSSSSSQQEFQCDQCDYTCVKDITLKKHVNTKHQIVKKTCEKGHESVVKAKFNCDECSFICNTKKLLKKHKSKEHNQKSSEECIIDNDSNNENIEETLCLVCRECQKKFKSNNDLDAHMETHHKAPTMCTIKCENCGMEFSKKENLEIHMKEEHPNCECTAVDVCDDCLKEWQDK